MNRKLLLFIFLKDLSILICCFLLLKYDLVNKAYSEAALIHFPSAAKMNLVEIVGSALYYSWFIILVDLFVNFMIINEFKILINKITKSPFIIGILLHIPVVIIWILIVGPSEFNRNVPLQTSIILSGIIAGLVYQIQHKPMVENELEEIDAESK